MRGLSMHASRGHRHLAPQHMLECSGLTGQRRAVADLTAGEMSACVVRSALPGIQGADYDQIANQEGALQDP